MELRYLKAFVAVAELRSFRLAARRLHLSQPPLSRQIQALEADLGVRLLERGSRREVTLTEAGRLFQSDAAAVLAGLEAARRRLQAHDRQAPDRLVIGSYSELSARVLPALLPAFQESYPGVEVTIRELNGSEELAALRSGELQLGLVADHGLSVDPDLQTEPLLDVPLLAVFPAGHPLARGRAALSWEEAAAAETILYRRPEHAPCYHQRLPELLARAKVTPRALRAVDGMNNVLALAAAGYGVAVVPDIFDGPLPPPLRARRLRLPPSVPPLQLSLVWPRDPACAARDRFLEVARRRRPDGRRGASS